MASRFSGSVQGRLAPSSTSRAPGTRSTGTRCMQTRKGTARRHRNSVLGSTWVFAEGLFGGSLGRTQDPQGYTFGGSPGQEGENPRPLGVYTFGCSLGKPGEHPRPLGVPLAARGGLRVNNLARSVPAGGLTATTRGGSLHSLFCGSCISISAAHPPVGTQHTPILRITYFVHLHAHTNSCPAHMQPAPISPGAFASGDQGLC